jgi:hypothetical protein
VREGEERATENDITRPADAGDADARIRYAKLYFPHPSFSSPAAAQPRRIANAIFQRSATTRPHPQAQPSRVFIKLNAPARSCAPTTHPRLESNWVEPLRSCSRRCASVHAGRRKGRISCIIRPRLPLTTNSLIVLDAPPTLSSLPQRLPSYATSIARHHTPLPTSGCSHAPLLVGWLPAASSLDLFSALTLRA